jgi:hypothetical protein
MLQNSMQPIERENRQNGNQESSQEGTREEGRKEGRQEVREKEVSGFRTTEKATREGDAQASPSVFLRTANV